tara:strand:+ start:822 stop:1751 length:930 start_codon:yes stop_codon:yes gene_type:complete
MKNSSISVVVPIFNESENIIELNKRLLKVLIKCNHYEIIYVNDGSNDDSLEILKKLSFKNNSIKIISLSRNFGQQTAYKAGIEFVTKDITVLMDGDLQDPPEIIPDLVKKINEKFNIVYAIRKKRKGNYFKRISYFLFYRILNIVSNLKIPIDSGDFSALDKKSILILNQFKEKNIFLRGVRAWIGLKQTSIEYQRDLRFHGKHKLSFFSLLKLAFDGIVSFSSMPLRIASFFGFTITFISSIYIIYILIKKFFLYEGPTGWPSLMIVILFIGGVQLLFLGIIGEYLARIYDEVKQRPNYIIEEKINIS